MLTGARPAVERRSGDGADVLIEEARRRQRRRRFRTGAVILIAGALVAVGFVVVSGGQSRAPRFSTARPRSSSAVVSQPTGVKLVWDEARQDGTNAFRLGDPVTGASRTVAGPAEGSCLVACIARIGGSVFAGSPSGVYRLGLNGSASIRVADGQLVFAAARTDEFYVAITTASAPLGSMVRLVAVSGARLGGPWKVPAGYALADPPRATESGIVVTSFHPGPGPDPAGSSWLSLWDPVTGHVARPFATGAGTLVDATASPDRHLAAWTQPTSRIVEGSWQYHARQVTAPYTVADLTITDLSNGRRRVVQAPSDSLGFIGGGAFSPDGSTLAAFVQLNHVLGPGLNGQVMELVLINTATGSLHPVSGSATEFGEAYGFASWSHDGRWVFFGGLTSQSGVGVLGHMGAYRPGTSRAAELRLPANYSAIAT